MSGNSGNELDAVCDEDKLIAYIYDDVDDSDIFATGPLNDSFADSDPKSDAEPLFTQNPEITPQHELKMLVEKLHKEKETLLLRISELHKTARAEVERKNNRIKDLEKEKDNILFRRGNNIFRSKPLDVDARVPVLQQVEKELTNEEFQNFNTRYRIPKKKDDKNEIHEIGIENDEQFKKLKEETHNEKYWSAYPRDKTIKSENNKSAERNCKENAEKNKTIPDPCSGRILSPQVTDNTDKNKQDGDRGSNMAKDSNDRSRPREKLNPRMSIKKESKTIKSPSNEHRLFIEGYEQKNVQRSKSFSRYRNISPENHVKQPRSPSRERIQEQVQHRRYQSETIDKNTEPEHRRIHSNLTSRSRKNRSPSNEHIFTSSENNSTIKKTISSRSRSKSRFKPRSPEYRIRQPRTPSGEREAGELSRESSSSRSNSINGDTKSRKSRVHCRPTSKENEYVHSSTSTNKYGFKDKEHARKVNRIRSRDRNNTYSRRDSRSDSQEKEDICDRNRLNSKDKLYKDGLDNHKLGTKSNRNNSKDNEVRNSRNNERKNARGDNRDKILLQSSSRDKSDSKKYSERLDSKYDRNKDRDARDIKIKDLREKCPIRSRSYSRETDNRRRGLRRSRSASKDRLASERETHGVKQDNSKSARNDRRLNRDRSRSNSVERAGNRRFSHKGELLVDSDRHENVTNYKCRNRSRSDSSEKPLNYTIQELQNRDSKSRPRNFGRLKEKLLRHSVDRERALREDKHTYKPSYKNLDKKSVHLNNEVDCSDVDDIKLHLSGESDIDNFNMDNGMEKRNEELNLNDTDFDLLKDLHNVDYQKMTDDQMERMLQAMKKVYDKVSSDVHCKEVVDQNFDAKFIDCKNKLTDNEEVDNRGQIQRNSKSKVFFPIDVEELDYEPSHSGQHCQEEQIRKSEQNNSSENFRITQQNKSVQEGTMQRHENVIGVQQSTNSAECHDKNSITIYGTREQRKKKDDNHKKGTKSLQIHRTNTHPQPDGAKSIQNTNSCGFKKKPEGHTNEMCDAERKYQRHSLEIKHENCASDNKDSMHETNKERRGGKGQEINKEKSKNSYNDIIKSIQNVKQGCNTTRIEISDTRSKVTKAVSNKKHIYEDEIGKSKDGEETGENENQLKTVAVEEKNVVSKKKEKISLYAYKSRKQSTGEADINGVNYGTDVPETKQIASSIPTKNVGDMKSVALNNNDNLSTEEQVTLPVNGLPKMDDGTKKNGENKHGTNPLVNEVERFVQDDELIVKKIGKEEKSFYKAPNQDESKIPMGYSLVVDVITDDIISNGVVKVPEKLIQGTDLYTDANNYLHDLSISDDDDNANNKESDKKECVPEDGKKINILSHVTIIQSPSYTPPHPPPRNFYNATWENASKNVKFEGKETKAKNSRKSLFKDFQATNETEQAVTDIHRIEHKVNHNSGGNSPALPDVAKNIAQVADITSRKTINPRARDSSECLDAIQQAVVEDSFAHISLSTTSNVITEKLDTEELQKCLEEDIATPHGNKLDNRDTGKNKEIDDQARTTDLVKNKNCSKNTDDKHVEETKIIETEQNRETNNGVMMLSPKEKKCCDLKDNRVLELFGEMTPSPCKAMKEILEGNVNKDKVKRNLVTCEQMNHVNYSFKIRDKIKDPINKKVSDKKVIEQNDRNVKRKGIRMRSKSADESKLIVMIIPPEDVNNCEVLKQAMEVTTKKAFCSNPTYIFDSRATPGKVFESPNHYIQKKNQEVKELKEKAKRTLNTKTEEQALPESTPIGEHHLIQDTSIGEENVEAKKLEETKTTNRLKHQKHKGKKKTISNEESFEGEEAKNNKPNVKAKRGRKNINNKNTEEDENLPLAPKQSKKTLLHSSSTDDKKTRIPSFKIKIKPRKGVAKKKVSKKKRSLLDTEESSDSFQEPDKACQKERTEIEESLSGVANVPNNKRKVEEKECIPDLDVPEDQSLSSSQLSLIRKVVETENNKVKVNNKEKKPKLKGIKRKKARKAENTKKNKDYEQEIKVEQKCKRLNIVQEDICTKSEEVKESSEVMNATATAQFTSKEKIENREEILNINELNTKRKGASFEDNSVSNNTYVTEPVKTIKRITPKRIDDSSVITEEERQFKKLKSKRELFIENPETVNINNKRKRLSSSGDDCRKEAKCQKMFFTESITITEQDVIDNGARTQIKISESKVNLELDPLSTTTTGKDIISNDSQIKVLDTKVDKEVTPLVGPHCSPLYRIEQTLDTLSRKCEDATKSDSRHVNTANSQLQLPHEGAYMDINDTFPEIQLDTIDKSLLGSFERQMYSQLSIFSMSNKSMVGESRSKSDDTGDANAGDKIALSFRNLLNTESKTSTPIKRRETLVVELDNIISKDASESVVDNTAGVNVAQNHNLDISSSVVTSSNNVDLQKSVPEGSNAKATLTTVSSKLITNMNVSDCRPSLGMTSNSNCIWRTHVKFSRTLKRDRRRPISMVVVD